MAKPIVFVIGASGNIGKSTVNALSSMYGQKLDIKAGVRKPEKVSELNSLEGVTVVQAEMGQKEKLKEIFKGVGALFIVVPGTLNRVELATDTAKAAKDAGVKYMLVVSVPTQDQVEVIAWKQFIDIETIVSSLGVPCTFFRLPYFVDNYFGYQATIKGQSVFHGPADPSKPFASIVVEDAGVAAAVILASPEKHAGKAYTIVSDRHTFGEVAQAFTKALDRQVKYVRISYEDAKASFLQLGAPKWQVDVMMEFYRLVDAGSPVANQPNINHFFEITGKKPTDLSTWVMKVASAFK